MARQDVVKIKGVAHVVDVLRDSLENLMGTTLVIERGAHSLNLGFMTLRGEGDWWNLATTRGNVIAQADNPEALERWAKKQGIKRTVRL